MDWLTEERHDENDENNENNEKYESSAEESKKKLEEKWEEELFWDCLLFP